MTEELTLDIAHEGRARRRVTLSDGPASMVLAPLSAEAAPADLRVGPGVRVRAALLLGAEARVAQVARRAVLAGALEEVALFRVGGSGPFGDTANALRSARPDVVIAQADDREGDAIVELLEALRAGCFEQEPPPLVVACGDNRARLAAVAGSFPTLAIDDLGRPEALATFVKRMRELRRAGDDRLVLRDEALEWAAVAIARATGDHALIVDVTGDSTSLVRGGTDGAVRAAHAVPLGIGPAADRVVARAGLDRVRQWIPWPVDAPSLLERVFNRARWPDAVPATGLALTLEIALAHEALAHALSAASALGPPAGALRAAPTVALTGRLADLPRAAQSLLVAVNALQAEATGSYLREREDALVALGAAAARYPIEERSMRAALFANTDRLALVVPLAARSRTSLVLRSGGARREERVEPEALTSYPISGPVEVTCKSPELRVHGEAGALGVLVDARSRPLFLPPRDADRVPTIARWFAALDALPS